MRISTTGDLLIMKVMGPSCVKWADHHDKLDDAVFKLYSDINVTAALREVRFGLQNALHEINYIYSKYTIISGAAYGENCIRLYLNDFKTIVRRDQKNFTGLEDKGDSWFESHYPHLRRAEYPRLAKIVRDIVGMGEDGKPIIKAKDFEFLYLPQKADPKHGMWYEISPIDGRIKFALPDNMKSAGIIIDKIMSLY